MSERKYRAGQKFIKSHWDGDKEYSAEIELIAFYPSINSWRAQYRDAWSGGTITISEGAIDKQWRERLGG